MAAFAKQRSIPQRAPPPPVLQRTTVSTGTRARSPHASARPIPSPPVLHPTITELPDDCLEDVETDEVTITPELLDALRRIAPRRSHPKVPYVVALALATVVGVVAHNRATREFFVFEGSRYGGLVDVSSPSVRTPPAQRSGANAVAPLSAMPSGMAMVPPSVNDSASGAEVTAPHSLNDLRVATQTQGATRSKPPRRHSHR